MSRRIAVGLSLALAAVVFALVAVPAFLDRGEPSRFERAGAEGVNTGPVPGAPGTAVATDGTDIFILRDGERGSVLVEGGEGPSTRFVAVSVRPRSTPSDLTVAVLELEEGRYGLRWIRWEGGEPVEPLPLPRPYQVTDARADGAVPSPVWSPDGGNLAWLEGGGEGPFGIRAIQWRDGPGSPDDRNDDATWALDIRLSPGARLQEWTWLSDDGTTARGQWVVTDPGSGGEAGRASLVAIPVERQGDGALALPDPEAPHLQPDDGPAYIDVANGHIAPGEQDVRYFLRGPSGGGGEGARLTLSVVQASDQREALQVPEALVAEADPASAWMSAAGNAVLVGAGDRAWVVTRDGRIRPIAPSVRHAAFIRE